MTFSHLLTQLHTIKINNKKKNISILDENTIYSDAHPNQSVKPLDKVTVHTRKHIFHCCLLQLTTKTKVYLYGFLRCFQTDFYSLDHNPHGLCVVFNNEKFRGGLGDRPGTQEDSSKYIFIYIFMYIFIYNTILTTL